LFFAALALGFFYRVSDRTKRLTRVTCGSGISRSERTCTKLSLADRKELASIEIYFFECEPSQAETLLEIARGRWTTR
jgi:hypothetical protein